MLRFWTRLNSSVLLEDLADPDAPARLIARVTAAGIMLGGLVNNAGFGPRGFYAPSPWGSFAMSSIAGALNQRTYRSPSMRPMAMK
jgi:short-subunit dehydrogenase